MYLALDEMGLPSSHTLWVNLREGLVVRYVLELNLKSAEATINEGYFVLVPLVFVVDLDRLSFVY